MAARTLRHRSIEPTHPGEMLREIVLPGTGRSKAEIARLLGVSRTTLYEVLGCRQPVTPGLAARLGKLFGNGPGLWVRMQAEHDVWRAEHDIDASAIEALPVI